MRETNFIQQNKKKWNEFEQMLETKENNPDKLSDLFVQITDDLSYSRTFYPNRSVRFYLNNIAQQVFYKIYKRRSGNLKNFRNFWAHQLPEIVYESRKELLLSFFIFITAMAIGVISSIYDPQFAKLILGDSYIKMTIENINSGDPMAVYKKSGQVDMFLGISINNLLVSFRTFIMGVFLAIGTIAIMIYNGIMVGTFQYFFYEKGLFLESFLTIWLHGTIEISCIIIAGGAGLKLGSGLIFPGTYSRMQAFQMSAKKGLGLMVGITPLIVLAAIIESFVTRYTKVPDMVKLSLILVSLLFILGYFVIIPLIKARRGIKHVNYEKLPAEINTKIDFENIQTSGESFKNIFIVYKKYFSKAFAAIMIGTILYTSVVTFLLEQALPNPIDYRGWFFISYLFDYAGTDYIIFANIVSKSILDDDDDLNQALG
ncbi:MAG: stage II sporulation protein M, partial [Cytophagaceae bacterium]|nr:stage II sporulation protein M [Cytophagaceae bacterium]